jgi:alkaline phosphatase
VSISAVGDTGMCSEREAVQRTSDVAARFGGPLLLLGDLAYDHGTVTEFMNCFAPAWGRFRGRWHPVPGNHEYGTPGAAGYLEYFGTAAAPQGRTYYSLRIGGWLVLMLDSNERATAGSSQYEFVRHELVTNRTTCTLAAWHHPLVTSGPNGPNPFMRDLAALIHQHGAEIILSGHDHLYERMGKQNADGRADPHGVRQFIVGTGGARSYPVARRDHNSEVVVSAHGVLRLTLHAATYDWAFVDASGATLDSGADVCY